MKLVLSALILLWNTNPGALAQSSGTSLVRPDTEAAFVYRPQDTLFWSEVENGMRDKNYTYVIKIGNQKARDSKGDSLDQAEGRLAMAGVMKQLGLNFGATEMYRELAKTKPGTQVAFQALTEIERIIKTFPSDFESLTGDLILDQDVDNWPKHLTDFTAYVNAEFNRLSGYDQWADAEYKKITPESYWDFKVKYNLALADVAAGRIDSAIERFSSISSNQAAPATLRTEATHQYARLVFEKGDFVQSNKILKGVDLGARERGLVLLERAWAKYYLKDYSRSLGLLAALDAPIFEPARSGEASVLKMLIYKELCYYDAVADVAKDFNKRFAKSMEAIRKRRDLRQDQGIVHLSVLDPRILVHVDFLNQLKEERRVWSREGLDKNEALAGFTKRYDFKIRELNEILNWKLLKKTREVGDLVLDWADQVSFLDYQSRVDGLRIQRITEDGYKSEEVPHMTFDRVYWTFTNEYWLDELDSLKVLVSSQCKAGGTGAPKGAR